MNGYRWTREEAIKTLSTAKGVWIKGNTIHAVRNSLGNKNLGKVDFLVKEYGYILKWEKDRSS